MKKWNTVKGDSTDIKNITVEGVTDYTDYTGKLVVLDTQVKGHIMITQPSIAPDTETGFTCGLTPGQTDTLSKGNYIVVFEITKTESTVATYRREINWQLNIMEALIPTS